MRFEWKSVTVGLVLGILLGGFGVMRCAPMGSGGMGRNPEKFHQHMMQQFTAKLGLTVDQQTKVSAILEGTRAQLDTLRQETRPRFSAIRENADRQIRVLLTPEQQQKFDIMSAEMKSRMEKRRGQKGGRSGW